MKLSERLRQHEFAIAHQAAKLADFGDPKPQICLDLLEAAEALEATERTKEIFHPHCWRCQKQAPSSGGCQSANCGILEIPPTGETDVR